MAAVMRRNRRINQRPQNSSEKAAKSLLAEHIYGFHPVLAALGNPARRKRRLLLTPEARESLATHAAAPALAELENGVADCRTVTRREIDALLAPGAVHQGLCRGED